MITNKELEDAVEEILKAPEQTVEKLPDTMKREVRKIREMD